ncbi:hypothetical protein AM593_00632, partial [Mytilus galloprovincialis]
MFNFTKTKEGTKFRKNLTVEELITNLKMLVRQSIVRDNLDESDKHVLVGKRVKHRFDTNGEDQWYTGKVISQVPAFQNGSTLFMTRTVRMKGYCNTISTRTTLYMSQLTTRLVTLSTRKTDTLLIN